MRCISPLKASLTEAGERTYSSRKAMKGLVPFEFECRRCLPCRLNVAREKAIRAFHEARMHENNIFLTLTYSDKHLESPRLIYSHFQNFMKSLRERITGDVTDKDLRLRLYSPYYVTGEYGEETKRPHWHAIIFNYSPSDLRFLRTSDRGDKVYASKFIDDLWGKNDPEVKPNEIGEVTIESAGYVARYAAKKLVHGKDQEHDFHPIHKTSSRRAIGRSWIEKYYKQTFLNGFVVLPNGSQMKIPRYYVDWAKKHQPEIWLRYVTEVQPRIIEQAEKIQRKEEAEFLTQIMNYHGGAGYPLTRSQVKERVLRSKFKRLQENLKL